MDQDGEPIRELSFIKLWVLSNRLTQLNTTYTGMHKVYHCAIQLEQNVYAMHD